MNKEVVTALVHSPKRERKKPTTGGSGVKKDEDAGEKKNGRHRRRWHATEVNKIFERNSQLMRQLELRKEIERNLVDTKTKLEREIALLKSRKAVGTHENEAVRERNKQLSQDVFLMKNILVKLNFELERYQEKLRKYEDDIPTQDTSSETRVRPRPRPCVVDGEITAFAPLLHAYEESLKEKDDLIKDLRSALENLSGKMKDIIKENSDLHSKMAESEKKGEVTYSDWLSVNRELTITVEQNQLLTRQAKLAQSKIAELKSVFQAKLNEVCCERDDLAAKLSQIRSDFLVLRGKSSAVEAELDRLKEDSADRIPKSVHEAYIAECKRLLGELKSRHEEERSSLVKRVAALEAEARNLRPALSSTSVMDENALREIEKRVHDFEECCIKSERQREFLKNRLHSMIAFSKELISEHEGLLRAINGELKVNSTLSSRIEQIRGQLKGVELETLEQLRTLDENISCQVERVNQVRSEQDAEIRRLKEQLAQRDSEIQRLKEEAKKREEDIEVVWKAALSDSRERNIDEIVLDFKNSVTPDNK